MIQTDFLSDWVAVIVYPWRDIQNSKQPTTTTIPALGMRYLFVFIALCLIPIDVADTMELTCEETNAMLHKRIEEMEIRLQEDDDNLSILEMSYKQLQNLLQKSIPKTDVECKFNWLMGRCEPECKCKFVPTLGDYWPSRSCRLVPAESIDTDRCPHQMDIPWSASLFERGKAFVLGIGAAVRDSAPPTDEECRWNLELFKCVPVQQCVFEFHLGDYSLDRACRLRLEDPDELGFGIDDDEELLGDHDDNESSGL